MYHRTPAPESGFNTEWKHTSSLLVSKTVKDLVVQNGKEIWTHEMIESVFFRDQNVWIKLNSLIVAMQKYVLEHPDYARFVNLEIFKKAHSGDK